MPNVTSLIVAREDGVSETFINNVSAISINEVTNIVMTNKRL
jgi:hypothetical protein